MVSIVLPCYNVANTIGETLQSIVNQSYEDFEIIAINDGSQDSTLDILKLWAQNDSRIKVYSQSNRGVSSARNNALDRCSGEFICFVDADDLIEPDYLVRLLELMTSGASMDLAICGFTKDMRLSSNIHISFKSYQIDNAEFINKTILRKGFNPQIWCMLFRSDIIHRNNIHFEVGCTRGEDREFFMKYVIYARGIIYTMKPLYHYRVSASSAMSTLNEKSLTSIEASWRTYLYYNEHKPLLANVVLMSYYATIWKFVILCKMRKNVQLASIVQERYNVRDAICNLRYHPNIMWRLSSYLYIISPYLFDRLCYIAGFFTNKR